MEGSQPWKSSVINFVLCIKRVIKQCPNKHCHSWRWWEYCVKNVVELQQL